MNNNITQDIKQIINIANRCYYGFQEHMKSHVLSRSGKWKWNLDPYAYGSYDKTKGRSWLRWIDEIGCDMLY
jgi:hypothetical protein